MTDHLITLVRAADPLAGHHGSALTSDAPTVLQAALDRISPVPRRRRRRALAVAVAIALLALTGVAVATDIRPFAGISAAIHQPAADDGLSPAAAALITRWNTGSWTNGEKLLPETVRVVRELPSGRRLYVLTSESHHLCILVASPVQKATSGECTMPLTRRRPTTVRGERPNRATPLLTFGVARDDVAAVTFTSHGRETTVPVEHNVWAYEGPSSALASLTVHYTDGATRSLGRG